MYFCNSHIFHNLINHSLPVTNSLLFYTYELICDLKARRAFQKGFVVNVTVLLAFVWMPEGFNHLVA